MSKIASHLFTNGEHESPILMTQTGYSLRLTTVADKDPSPVKTTAYTFDTPIAAYAAFLTMQDFGNRHTMPVATFRDQVVEAMGGTLKE